MKKPAIVLIATALFGLSLMLACSEERGQVLFKISEVYPSNDPFGDVLTNDGAIPSDSVDIIFGNDVKNPNALGSLTYADVMVENITFSFARTDGGSDKPDNFRISVSYRVPANSSTRVDGLGVVPATMKTKFPISDLIFYGYERSTNFSSIKMDVLIEAEGHTIEGDRVYASGRISIELANWAD
jgi:hypothetical protein